MLSRSPGVDAQAHAAPPLRCTGDFSIEELQYLSPELVNIVHEYCFNLDDVDLKTIEQLAAIDSDHPVIIDAQVRASYAHCRVPSMDVGAKAICQLEFVVKHGRRSPVRQFALGVYLQELNNDFKKAFVHFKKAADQGYTPAQYSLAECYMFGWGTKYNYREAVRLCRLAAYRKYPLAQYAMGLLYEQGRILPKNIHKATKWYRRAAMQGYKSAESRLKILKIGSFGVNMEQFWVPAQVNWGTSRLEDCWRKLPFHGPEQEKNEKESASEDESDNSWRCVLM